MLSARDRFRNPMRKLEGAQAVRAGHSGRAFLANCLDKVNELTFQRLLAHDVELPSVYRR